MADGKSDPSIEEVQLSAPGGAAGTAGGSALVQDAKWEINAKELKVSQVSGSTAGAGSGTFQPLCSNEPAGLYNERM